MESERPVQSPDPGSGNQFVKIAPLYDELMHDVPYAVWRQYLERLLELHEGQCGTVLDLACGTGNVTELLYESGFQPTGVDISEGMIAEAKRKARDRDLPLEYFVQDAAELNLPGRRFNLCVSLFDSLNYVVEPAHLQRAMCRVWEHLTDGGLFIFDMNSEFALMNRFFDQSNRATTARLRYDWESEYFPETRRCRIGMRFWYREDNGLDTAFTEEHWQYAYRESEVVSMLEKAGFTDIAAYQAYSLKPTHTTSDRIFYCARRDVTPETRSGLTGPNAIAD